MRMTPSYFRRLPHVALIAALLPFLGLCFYNQPYWDDLGYAASSRQIGIWAAQQELYRTIGGRFVSMFLLTAGNPLTYGWWHGVKATALLGCIGTAATLWSGLRILTKQRLPHKQTGSITGLLLLVYIAAIPDIHSSLYWFAGQVVHQLPMLLLLVVPVAVARAHQTELAQRCRWLVLAGACTFIVGGTSELAIIQLGLFLVLAAALSAHRCQWTSLKIWGGLLGILATTCIIHIWAPGNYVRLHDGSARVPLRPGALLLAVGQCLRLILWQPTTLLLLAVPILFAPHVRVLGQHRPAGMSVPLPLSVAVLLAGFLMSMVLMLVTLGGPPLLARATNVLLWWLLIGWCAALWAALPRQPTTSISATSRWVIGALLFVMTAAPTVRAWRELLVEAPSWARQCDARLPVYAAAAGRQGVITVPPIVGVAPHYVLVRGYDIQPGAGHVLNQVTAQYFGLDSVRTGGPLRPSF